MRKRKLDEDALETHALMLLGQEIGARENSGSA